MWSNIVVTQYGPFCIIRMQFLAQVQEPPDLVYTMFNKINALSMHLDVAKIFNR